MVKYGAHLSRRTILEGVEATGAEAAQVFLGSPKSWRPPAKLSDEEKLFWESYELPMFVHSSYIINPCSGNDAVRENSIRSLQNQFIAASEIKAKGVVVHAGHASGGGNIQDAVARWKDALERVDLMGVELLIENTAGGSSAPGRSMDGLKLLWETIGDYGPKICFDTCHAWAGNFMKPGGEPLDSFMKVLDELEAAGIEVGLTHLNGSLDPMASGRDHHSNLSNSLYDLNTSKAVAERLDVPAILETPGPLEVLRKELEALRA